MNAKFHFQNWESPPQAQLVSKRRLFCIASAVCIGKEMSLVAVKCAKRSVDPVDVALKMRFATTSDIFVGKVMTWRAILQWSLPIHVFKTNLLLLISWLLVRFEIESIPETCCYQSSVLFCSPLRCDFM